MATVATRIGPADNGRKMTLEEFREAEIEEGYRYELGRGVLEVTKVPNSPHGQVVWNLYQAVAIYGHTHPGVVLRGGGGSEYRLWLPGLVSGRNPDLSVSLVGQPKQLIRQGVPALVAEVVSARSGDRDSRIKREEYLAYGLTEYWIVDFLARRFTLLTRDGDVWREQIIPDAQAIPSVVLPGLATTVADLWANLELCEGDEIDEEDLEGDQPPG